jgi:tape measure domain-containing protein
VADETHGIEIEIDSRPSEQGKQRVIRSLDDIRKKTDEIGKAGADAGKRFSDGVGAGAADAAGKTARSLDEIKAKAKTAGDQTGRAGASGFGAWSRSVDEVIRGKTLNALNDAERRAIRVGQQIASGAGSFKAWSQQATQLQRVAGVLDSVGLASRGAGQQIAAGAGSFKTWSREADRITQAARKLDDLKAKSKAAYDQLQRDSARATSAFRAQTLSIDRNLASAARLQPTFAQLEASANRVSRARPFAGMQTSARSLLPDLLNLRNVLVGLGAVELGKYIVNTEAQFRGFDQALKIVTGSQAGARKEMEYAQGVAEKYGLRIKDLTSSYVGLLAASRGTSLEGEKSRQIFDAVTKAGVAYGLSNDNIRGSLLALQQMISKGQVQAEELRGQLGERLPGAFQVAARAMNVTTAELSKMLEQGQVVSADFLPKFAAQLNKEIPDGAQSAYSAFNAFLNVLDRITRVVANSGIFKGLADGAKGLGQALESVVTDGSLATLASGIGGLLTLLGQNAGLLKAAALAYGVYFAAVKVGVVLAWMGELIALQRALGATTAATALMGAGIKGLQAIMMSLLSTTALVTAGISLLLLAFFSINSRGNETAAVIAGLDDRLKDSALTLREAQQRAGLASVSVAAVGTEAGGAIAHVDNFAGAVGRAAQQLYELAKAKQQAALSDLLKQRGEAVGTYQTLRSQTAAGTEQRRQQINARVANAPGMKKVGAIVQGFGDILGVARDNASRKLGFGPDEQQLQAGMGKARQTVQNLDQAIAATRGNLEQFVTAQDRASVSTTKSIKPTQALNNALAQQAGATTMMDKAQAGLAVTRAQAAAELKAGMITQEQYVQRVGAAVAAVHNLRDAHKAAGQAAKDQREQIAENNRMIAQADRNAQRRQSIGDRYDDQPRFLDQLDKDSAFLDKMVGEWISVGDAVVVYTQAMRDADRAQMDLAKNKPFNDLLQGMNNELAIQTLILNGRDLEAEALRQKVSYEQSYGKMLPEQYRQLLANVAAQDMIARKLEDQRRIAGLYVQTVQEIQSAFEQFMNDAMKDPFKALLDYGKNIINSLKQLMVRQVSESIFGGIDREIEDMVSGRAGVQAATQTLVTNTDTASKATGDLADAMVDAAGLIRDAAMKSASQITGVPINSGSPTNAEGDIVVTGKRIAEQGQQTTKNLLQGTVEKIVGRQYTALKGLWQTLPTPVQNVLKKVGTTIEGGLNKLGIKLPKGIEGVSGAITKGLKGAGEGMLASSLVGKLGLKQSQTGAAIGGAIGSFIPGGSIIGGLLGGTIGGLFGKKKKDYGNAAVSVGEFGATAGASSGRGKGQAAAASGLAGKVSGSLNDIASRLGGKVTGNPNITIGTYDGKYRVSTVGQTGELSFGKKNKQKAYLNDFGDDQEAAIAFAVETAVKRGVITGISSASQRVITAGGTGAVDAAIQYEDLLRQAAKLKDPIKGAFDEIKRGMDATIDQLKAAGYTQDEIAQVQSVFQKQQKDALEQMTSGYKSFLDDITKGPDSGMTVFDQFQQAQKDFATVKAGLADGTTTQDQFTAAGQKLFDLARQTYGTSTPEFEAIKADLVTATQGALDRVTQAASNSGVTQAIQATADAAAAQRDQTNDYLAQIAASLQRDDQGGGYYGGGNYYGGDMLVQRQAY